MNQPLSHRLRRDNRKRAKLPKRLVEVMQSHQVQSALFLSLVLVIGAVLLFSDLADVYLWQDEAETALVSRNLLTYGLPLSTDGRVWVQQAPHLAEFTDDYIWIYHPWLQYFAVATSFAILGENTATARLPFALAGLAALLFFCAFVAHGSNDRRIARVAAMLLLLHVPSILLARQCRYYSLSVLFTVLTLDSYLRLCSDRPWAVPYFVLSLVLLFHSHYGAFFPTLVALVVHMLLVGVPRQIEGRTRSLAVFWARDAGGSQPRGVLSHFLAALLLVAVLTLPWTCLVPVSHSALASFVAALNISSSSTTSNPVSITYYPWERFLGLLGQSFLYITVWAFPLILGLGGLIASCFAQSVAWLRRPTQAHAQLDNGRFTSRPYIPSSAAFCQFVGLVVATNVLALSSLGWTFFRYFAHVLPLLLALLAVLVVRLIEHWPVAGYVLLMVLLVCNGLHILPYRLLCAAIPDDSRFWTMAAGSPATRWIGGIRSLHFRSEPWMYAQELTHAYEGPNEGLVAYLATRALPGQTVLVNYEDLPLQFYTNYRVLGGPSAHGLTPDLRPDWVIDRKYGPYRDLLADIVATGAYERVVIPYPDIRWENREDAHQHHYLTARSEDPVVLYRRSLEPPSAGERRGD